MLKNPKTWFLSQNWIFRKLKTRSFNSFFASILSFLCQWITIYHKISSKKAHFRPKRGMRKRNTIFKQLKLLKKKKLNPHLQKLDLKLLRTRLYKPKTRYSGILLKWTSVHLLYKTSLGIKMTKNLNWMTSRYCDLGFPSSLISQKPGELKHRMSFYDPLVY